MREELASSKLTLKQAEQTAASARVAKTIAEKEATAAKKENRQLHQSIKSSRAEDFTAIGSLRSRIDTLEEEREIVKSSYEEKVTALRADVSKAASEKDRLIHSLHELEASNAAYHSARINGTENGDGNDDELERLRIEKAQLLATVSQSAAKTEQRVRSLLTAQLSTNETEVIVERELRQTAETELADKRAKLRELQIRLEERERDLAAEKKSKMDAVASDKDKDILQHKLDCLTAQHDQQCEDNTSFKSQIQDMKAEHERVTKQCQSLEIEVRKVVQEKKFDRDVTTEVARLKHESATIGTKQSRTVSSPQPSENYQGVRPDFTLEELNDYIVAMKESMKEERDLYRESQADNEDLLALLAQQHLELAILKDALESFGGECAVEDAMREAEETAVDRFGECIHVS
jgi:hypothetical protein